MQLEMLHIAANTDRRRAVRARAVIFGLCFLIVATDGFDAGCISYIAPLLRGSWSLTASHLAPLFGSGLLGLAVGSFILGSLADRTGRKRVIVLSLLLFGVGSLMCSKASTLGWLIAFRFVTGCGLGGALPNSVTLSSEFVIGRHKTFLMTLMLLGFSAGLTFGSALGPLLIPAYGWEGVFVFGGVAPLLLAPVAWILLPESLLFMAGKARFRREAGRVLRLLGNAPEYEELFSRGRDSYKLERVAIRELFTEPAVRGTLLLWLTFFCTLWAYYQITNWLPIAISDAGISSTRAASISALLPAGGIIGSLIAARLMDRFNAYVVLVSCYLMGAGCVAMIGYSVTNVMWLRVDVFGAGLGLAGAQPCLNITAANFYPTGVRATGVACSLELGRVGSIIGAMSGGFILFYLREISKAFVFFALPVLLAGVAMILMLFSYGWHRSGSIDER